MDTLASRLKHVRENVLQISQAVMASQLVEKGGMEGVTAVSVMRYEKGERMPGADYVRAVAAISGVGVAWLLTGEGALRSDAERPSLRNEMAALTGSADHDRPRDREASEASAQTLQEVWRRMDRIDADPSLTPLQRDLRREAELAAYRASTQDREGRIAEVRVRLLEREVELAGRRTRGLEAAPGFEFIEPLARDEATRALFAAERVAFEEETRDRLARMEELLRSVGRAAG